MYSARVNWKYKRMLEKCYGNVVNSVLETNRETIGVY